MELEKMLTAVEERLRELKDAETEVSNEVEHERTLYNEVLVRIEREKQEFLQDLREEFEEESRDRLNELGLLEEEISRDNYQIGLLKDKIAEVKNISIIQSQLTTERTTAEEKQIYYDLEREVNLEMKEIQADIDDLKKLEGDYRRKLTLANSKLEETRVGATKVISNLRSQLSEARNQLRDAITQEKSLEQDFAKRENQYNSYYDTIEREDQENQRTFARLQTELTELVENQKQETKLIEDHIHRGKAKLDEINFAIGEFIQENSKLREKTEKALSNLKLGLDELIKGIVPSE